MNPKLEEYKTAAELAQEQDPKLDYFIYSYKDKAVNRFTPIFASDKEPKFMVDGIKTSAIKGNVKELTGLQLYFCGTFDLKTGLFDLFEEPQLMVDCDQVIVKLGGLVDGNPKA